MERNNQSESAMRKSRMLNKGIVPDTSTIINGQVSTLIKRLELGGCVVYIHEAVVAELESLANKGLNIGFKGLKELKKLTELGKESEIKVVHWGSRPSLEQIKFAKSGAIDAMIRQLAAENEAVLLTADRVQGEVASAYGIDVEYTFKRTQSQKLRLEKFFEKDITSVHLKSGCYPIVKRGPLGEQRVERVGDKKLSDRELEGMVRQLYARTAKEKGCYVEIEHAGAAVLQIGDMRIAIAKPSFSDALEITAVRPTAIVDLDSYRFASELKKRIVERQRGVLVAGPPGAGKSAFASGVARFLTEQGFIVKTMESPRDLQVGDEVTQYTKLDGEMANTADILLLVRPDYTIYDEVRKTSDFEIFADMRLAGVGMVGVVHASRPIDAVQRMLGRVELGMITQVVDTVVFIDCGEVSHVYDLRFTVKIPAGMFEQDLARPTILVQDFETGQAQYEIYTYGEQVVVMPLDEVSDGGASPESKLAAEQVKIALSSHVRDELDVEMKGGRATVYASKRDIPKLIGRGGRNIERFEHDLGVHIDVEENQPPSSSRSSRSSASRSSSSSPSHSSQSSPPQASSPTHPSSSAPTHPPQEEVELADVRETKRSIVLLFPPLEGKEVDVFFDEEYVFTAGVKKGEIKVPRRSDAGERLAEALEAGCRVWARKV
ncbi:MAG: ATPase, T2SS/T4P/T4SS family, partial [Methermicoccaceae archaeon]